MQAYVIHVSTAEERRRHVEAQLKNQPLKWDFILEGDKDSISLQDAGRFFKGHLLDISGVTSCAYKHFLAYEKFLASAEPFALILEDDVVFYRNFSEVFPKIETGAQSLKNFMITLEDSDCRYVPKSQRRQGQYIYPTSFGTTTAAYIIDRGCAENMLKKVTAEKTELPIDWFHAECMKEGVFKMYRTFPPVARQLTFDGTTPSLISDNRVGFRRIWGYRLQKWYKKLLYEFR